MKEKWSEEKIARMVSEGRGKGTGPNYKPWICVRNISSKGISRRPFSSKTGRHHELLSNVEWHTFVLLEYAENVIDIFEQYPLDRNETQSIAARINIKHPTYPKTQIPCVMTTDFLVKRQISGQSRLEALSCKTADDLEDPRTLEKLEIERAYFDELGIPHRLIIDTELPKTKIRNLLWFREAALDDNGEADYPYALRDLSNRMMREISRTTPTGSLAQYCTNFDARAGAQTGTGLRIARALLWSGELRTDLNEPNLPAAPVRCFAVAETSQLRALGS